MHPFSIFCSLIIMFISGLTKSSVLFYIISVHNYCKCKCSKELHVLATWRERDFRPWCLQDNLQIIGLGVAYSALLLPQYETDFICPQEPVHLIAHVVHTSNAELRNVIGQQWGKGQAVLTNSTKTWMENSHCQTLYQSITAVYILRCFVIVHGQIDEWPETSITKQHSLQESSHACEKVDCTSAIWWFTPYLWGQVTHVDWIFSKEAQHGGESLSGTWNGPWMLLKHFSSKRWALSASPSSSQPIANIPWQWTVVKAVGHID